MKILEEHSSPDGFLRLIVTRDDTGDTTIGFDGYQWHTHGDILAAVYKLPEEEAIREYIDSILLDYQIIAISRVNGSIRNVWPSDDPIVDCEYYKASEELLEFRYWSGTPVHVSPE